MIKCVHDNGNIHVCDYHLKGTTRLCLNDRLKILFSWHEVRADFNNISESLITFQMSW